jgi:release factor family 2
MEAAGPTPPGALRPDALRDIANAFDAPGPFLSVVLATEGGVPNAAQRNEVRWRDLRDTAAAAGADPEALAGIDDIIPDAHHEGEALAVVASALGVHVVEHDTEPPRREVAYWAPLPSVTSVLRWRQARVPYMVVNVDRTGGDIVVVDPTADEGEAREHASGGRGPVHKAHGGGWTHRRYQQRVENAWKENVADAARDVERLAEQHAVQLIVLAGDPRAEELLRAALSRGVLDLLRPAPDARRRDGGVDEHAPGVRRLVASVGAEHTVALLQRFEEERGQQDRAADGPFETIAALARANVDVLLVPDDPDDDRMAYYGAKPLDLASTPDDLRALGVEDVHEGRLVDVVLRAAFGSGAAVHVVPHAGPVAGSVGALLRWSTSRA